MLVISVLILFCINTAYSYIAGPQKVTFDAAQAYCVGLGSNLATIGSHVEQDAARRECFGEARVSGEGCWFGLNDKAGEGTFRYIDGTPFGPTSYTNWYPGEPNNAGNEDCVEVSFGFQGRWNDYLCGVSGYPLCNDPPPLQCPDGSTQVGGINADIGGCGLQNCDARYDLNTIEQCRDRCSGNSNCNAFNWAPLNGDRNHMNRKACTMYTPASPTSTWGPNQIFCAIRRRATCADILWTGPLWGYQAKGVKLGRYMRGDVPLQFIGCVGNGCHQSSFYCRDGAGSIEFGATAGAVRSLVSNGNFPTSFSNCCSAARPDDICNSPDDQASVNEICRGLGYAQGTFTVANDNWCSEPHFHQGIQGWANDFPPSDTRYGRTYTCTGASSALRVRANMVFEPELEEGTFGEGTDEVTGANKGYYYLQISQSTLMIICGLIAVILIFNIILLWRANCGGKGRKYYRVKNFDTETDTA